MAGIGLVRFDIISMDKNSQLLKHLLADEQTVLRLNKHSL